MLKQISNKILIARKVSQSNMVVKAVWECLCLHLSLPKPVPRELALDSEPSSRCPGGPSQGSELVRGNTLFCAVNAMRMCHLREFSFNRKIIILVKCLRGENGWHLSTEIIYISIAAHRYSTFFSENDSGQAYKRETQKKSWNIRKTFLKAQTRKKQKCFQFLFNFVLLCFYTTHFTKAVFTLPWGKHIVWVSSGKEKLIICLFYFLQYFLHAWSITEASNILAKEYFSQTIYRNVYLYLNFYYFRST